MVKSMYNELCNLNGIRRRLERTYASEEGFYYENRV